MASTTQDRLYETFVAVSGQQDSNLNETLDSGEEIAASLSETVKQLVELQGSNAAEASGSVSTGGTSSGRASTAGTTSGSSASTAGAASGGSDSGGGTAGGGDASGSSASTQIASSSASTGGTASGISASAQNANGSSDSTASTTGGIGSTVESIATTVLESGMGMVPLIVGLLGLFGGGGTPAPPALVKYAMPDPIYFEGADTGSDTTGADYDQMGMPRAYGAAPNGVSAQGSGMATPGGSGSSGSSTTSSPVAPQITVNVQAMDSQSFLDHSSEIAQAVRDAMLNSNAINDVVNDL